MERFSVHFLKKLLVSDDFLRRLRTFCEQMQEPAKSKNAQLFGSLVLVVDMGRWSITMILIGSGGVQIFGGVHFNIGINGGLRM